MQLLEHNKTAYLAVKDAFSSENRTCIIHPTGTGKTYVALQAIRDCKGTCLYLTALKENLAYFERTLAEELGKVPGYCSNIYRNLQRDLPEYPSFDLIILDEFHRCGAPDWEEYVYMLLSENPDAKVLGLSATPVRYLDNERNMAEELFENNVSSEITLASAIAGGLLNTPEYHGCVYSFKEDLERMEQALNTKKYGSNKVKAKKFYELAKRQIENSTGLEELFDKYLKKNGKYIVFCRNKEHLSAMIKESDEWFSGIERHIYRASSGYNGSSLEISRFEDDNSNTLRLLFCIDMLNEGSHLTGVTGVIMLRPTESANIYLQQLGRALSVDADGKPQIFDIVNNSSLLVPAREVWGEINAALVNAGKTEVNFDILDRDLEIIGLLHDFFDAVYSSWESRYETAKEYAEKHGSIRYMPFNYENEDGVRIGAWICRQRSFRRKDALPEEKIKLLDAIGIEWDPAEAFWYEGYNALKKYAETHRDFVYVDPKTVFGDNKKLSTWINNQRKAYTTGYLSDEKIKLLKNAGFVFNPKDAAWMKSFRALEEYAKNNDVNTLPRRHKTAEGFNLGSWFMIQKQKYRNPGTRKGTLTEEQIKLMESLGVKWEVRFDKSFMEGYTHAREYAEKGGCLAEIPISYECADGFRLGSWLHEKRRTSRQYLSEEHKKMLAEIGFDFEKKLKRAWNRHIESLKKYIENNGDINNMPVEYESDGFALGKWLAMQKDKVRNPDKYGVLRPERREELESLGYNFALKKSASFEERAEEIKKLIKDDKMSTMSYYEKTDTGFAPKKWLSVQQTNMRNNNLTETQKRTLKEILQELR